MVTARNLAMLPETATKFKNTFTTVKNEKENPQRDHSPLSSQQQSLLGSTHCEQSSFQTLNDASQL